ncbi:acetyl-CoA hydrolase/transferase C-terminal domain-containing protein [Lawsonibacter hominis]|jgi:succinyl-coA:coenzyme A transferase|uniref:acetyl-CoA hydrolase/transferase C-terminal domain-containing protein n=1 Tax=Lawsonibacter hominis TaxID=2763053 RepID=UPI002904DE57|nr:acetyl-CoA hydrolase [Flavonifractor sp.]MDU2195010.1 acetyl-CoA hydrolase/transferase C-terminal domain-containing protein [Clostridiales bacterium]
MERVAASLREKIMPAQQAAQFIKSQMTLAVSGFTNVSYPKAVPTALVQSGHARDLTLIVGAAVGDEIDGALVRAGLLKRRYGHQSNPDLRNAINGGSVLFSDIHISELPMNMNQKTGPRIDVAIVECTAVTEDGLYFGASAGSADAAVRNADKVIVEVNETLPMGLVGMHDIFDVGLPPHAKIIPINKASDRIGTPYMPCSPEKIAAIVLTREQEPAQKFKAITPATRKIGENVVQFIQKEIAEGRLPKNPGPIQSGVGSVGNAVLASLASSGFRGLSMYTEVMQDAAFGLLETGVLDFVSTSSVALCEDSRKRFYDHIEDFRSRIVIRPNEVSNHPEVIRRLGVIALNTPIEVDLYGNVNSTHIMGTKMMNGLGGSGDFARSGRISIFATESLAKNGLISCIVPIVSHVDQPEHDVAVVVTEQGIADLRWKAPRERAELLIENCAHPDYRPMLRNYYECACKNAAGKHTPHDLAKALSWHQRFLDTGTMKG